MDFEVLKNIWKTKLYFNLMIFVISILIIITLIVQLNLLPNLKNIAFDNILKEAKKVSYYMSDLVDYNNENINTIDKKLEVLLNDFNIEKVHYFNNNGKVIYSTIKSKIGTFNKHDYFNNIIAKGEVYYSINLKGSKSLEDNNVKNSVIEIYIPIMKNDTFVGAFEIYYNIDDLVKEFDNYSNLILKINILVIVISFIVFFILLYMISFKSLREKELISKDYLTKLYNRRYFYEVSENCIQLAKREKTPMTICMIDIDNFKQINDKYGHSGGDSVLKIFAKETKNLIRKSDILVRFGGEEFLLLLHNTNIDNAEVLANKIRKHFENLNNEIKFTISIGISEFKEQKIIDDIINEADLCLYKAKENGKNKVIKHD